VSAVSANPLRDLGSFLRDQRASDISLRELAKLAGVSNPYLSQVERGLRRPSADILQQIAKGLRVSAEALQVQAGLLDERQGASEIPGAVLGDAELSERQKQVLLDIYESFRRENALRSAEADAEASSKAEAPSKAKAAAPPAEPAAASSAEPPATSSGASTAASPVEPDADAWAAATAPPSAEDPPRPPAKATARPRRRTSRRTPAPPPAAPAAPTPPAPPATP